MGGSGEMGLSTHGGGSPKGAPVEIVAGDAAHEAQILALAADALGWGTDERYRDLYRWKHEQNPFGASPRWVALVDGRVAGFRTFLRWRFRRGDGTTGSAVRAVDTATHPDFQGRGIFRALTLGAVDQLRTDGVDFVFNTPNDNSRPGYLKMGWIELGRPPVAVAPRLGSLARIARSRTPAERWSLPCTAGTSAPDFFADPAAGLALDDRYDDRWRTDRSMEWCRWRYGLAALHYRVLTAGDLPRGDRLGEGTAVFRLRRRGHATEATVADMSATGAARRALLRGVRRASGADYVLAASDQRIDTTPAVAVPAFSPLVTWRALAMETAPNIDDFGFTVGDLELF
jgi:GNAT superfamily N-acetyltransferase